jgi:hypothetical protein
MGAKYINFRDAIFSIERNFRPCFPNFAWSPWKQLTTNHLIKKLDEGEDKQLVWLYIA